MKTNVLRSVLLLLVSAATALAQPNVLLLRDTTRAGISPSALERQYPPAVGENGAFRGREQAFFDTLNRQPTIVRYWEERLSQLPIRYFTASIQTFFAPDGQPRWVICAFEAPNLTDQHQRALLKTVAEFYRTYRFPLPTPTGFQRQEYLLMGGSVARRRSGRGLIATLEAARQTARPDTVRTLAFERLELTQVPEETYRFRNVVEIDLSYNRITHLPAQLTAALPKLRSLSLLRNSLRPDSVFFVRNRHLRNLNLQGNGLPDVPPTIRQNRRLTSLWLGHNPLTALGATSFEGLRRLRDLNLYNAGLRLFPVGLTSLRRLQSLDFYYNQFATLPDALGRLRRLEQLAIAHNQLTQLPESIRRLRRLRELYAHHNRIGTLPNGLARWRRLRVLDVSYNWFSVVPARIATLPALQELDLSNNNVQETPLALAGLRPLRRLYFRQNPVLRDSSQRNTLATFVNRLEAQKTEVFR